MAKYCGNCGSQMDDDARVCGQCGTPFENMVGNVPGVREENPEKWKKVKTLCKCVAALVIAVVILVEAVSVVSRYTGYNGLIRKVVRAYTDYDIDALVFVASDIYRESSDLGESYFERSVGSDLDAFEIGTGHNYELTFETDEVYTLSDRRLAVLLKEIQTAHPDYDIEMIERVVVAELTATARQGNRFMDREVILYLCKENGEWKLLYIR